MQFIARIHTLGCLEAIVMNQILKKVKLMRGKVKVKLDSVTFNKALKNL